MVFAAIRKFLASNNSPGGRAGNRRGITLRLEHLEARWVPSTLTVGSGQKYTTIQAALSAAKSGDTINVNPGTYTVSGNKGGLQLSQNNLTLNGVTVNGQSPKIQAADGSNPSAPALANDSIIDILGTGDKVSGFVIDGGANQSTTVDSAVFVGTSASATVSGNTIQNLNNPSIVLNGSKKEDVGFGVDVKGIATVASNNITGYGKAGVLVDGSSAYAKVNSNNITGVGATAVNTQYGVKVNNNGLAVVSGNNISGNVYTPYNGSNFASAAVWVNNSSKGSTTVGGVTYSNNINNNTVTSNQVGILIQGAASGKAQSANVTVSNNGISNNTADGVLLLNADHVLITQNSLSSNGAGVAPGNGQGGGITIFDGSNNTISNNSIDKSTLDGIYIGSSDPASYKSTGNSGSNNSVTNSLNGYGINLQSVDSSTFTNDSFSGNALGAILIVNSTNTKVS